ncbi:MAG: glutamate cyclase domain-containing protein, partial [Gemmataceae bacterium]
IRAIIQQDVGNRGLARDPQRNLITETVADFGSACAELAQAQAPTIGILTGFYIPHGEPPAAETDGPLGAVYLARALVPLGMRVVLLADNFCRKPLEKGIWASGLGKSVPIITLPAPGDDLRPWEYREFISDRTGVLTHLIALERVGPSHTLDSLKAQAGTHEETVGCFQREVAPEHFDRCHTMRGKDISANMSPAHHLFEEGAADKKPVTIGIGDGGNEIGMGKLPWEVVRRNIPGGATVACRIATDRLIVCGVSNWGAYGLAAGVRHLRKAEFDPNLFDLDQEQELLRLMVDEGPLVDGFSGQSTVTVDGLSFEKYAEALKKIRAVVES